MYSGRVMKASVVMKEVERHRTESQNTSERRPKNVFVFVTS